MAQKERKEGKVGERKELDPIVHLLEGYIYLRVVCCFKKTEL